MSALCLYQACIVEVAWILSFKDKVGDKCSLDTWTAMEKLLGQDKKV